MKEPGEPSKVVNFGERTEPSSERGGQLLNAVREIAARRMQALVGGMFEHVDDALFDLAEKAENNAAQMHYFDGMREVRKRRPTIERLFVQQVSRELGELATGRRTPLAPSSLPLGSIELALVGDSELEESLAITSMTGKAEARLARDLFAVNQRLAVIYGGIKIDTAANPIGPSAVAQAFRAAMRELNADMRVKLIVYKLFERYVMAALDELYAEVNDELARAGVLPALRHQVARTTGNPAADHAATGSATATETVDAAASDRARADEQLLDHLRELFNARRGPAPAAADDRAAPRTPPPTANELVSALSVLQSQAASPAMTQARPDSHTIAQQIAQLKQQLLAQLGALRGKPPNQVATIDEDTIDMVGMLFEFIVEDRNLPAEMQALLGRLQIPYLKAAILDRKLFAHRQHPARRLLDGLAEAAKGWSRESDRDGRLDAKLRAIVERLLQNFDDDLAIFEQLHAELQDFQHVQARRAELAEQRVAESARGHEKLEQARHRAAQEILGRIQDRSLPPLLHGLLTRAWANHLVLILLRHGEASPEFRDALRFVDDFLDSTRPPTDAAEREALHQLLPRLERSLRTGLSNLAFQEHDIERLLAQLRAHYRAQWGEDAAAEEPPLPVDAPPPIPDNLPPILRPGASAAEPEAYVEVLAEDTPELLKVRSFTPGIWIEFNAGETVERAKLSWVSPMSGRYLFVNRRGLKVGDFSPDELALALIDGRARLLDAAPLFDRALEAIVDRLSQPSGNTPKSKP